MDGIGIKGTIDYVKSKLDENDSILETLNDAQTIDINAIKVDIVNILQALEAIQVKQISMVLDINANTDAKILNIETKLNSAVLNINANTDAKIVMIDSKLDQLIGVTDE